MQLVLLVCEPESVVVLKVRHLRSATVRGGFNGLLLGKNATSYGLHADSLILRIIREDLDRLFQVQRYCL
jgi:hypothetical protein